LVRGDAEFTSSTNASREHAAAICDAACAVEAAVKAMANRMTEHAQARADATNRDAEDRLESRAAGDSAAFRSTTKGGTMGVPRRLTARLVASAVACSAFVPAALGAGPDVTIANVPLPVTVTNVPLPVNGNVSATVSGTVNANVTNAVLPVTGSVSVSSLPAVTVSSLPAVSLTLPANPFFDEINLLNGDKKAVGVGTGRLAVTTMTVTNFDGTEQQLFVFAPVFSGGGCSGTPIGGSLPIARALLPARSTMQLQFPTPMVFSGPACIAAEITTVMTGSVTLDVVGYSVP